MKYEKYGTGIAISANSQIAQYARLGQIEKARRVFNQMPDKNIVSWNSMVGGYFQSNQPGEARRLFDKMQERNTVSWNGLISGYVKNGMISEARKVFDSMPERNVVSWTSMVRGYMQEGMISEAESLFWEMPEKNVVSWTVMLGGMIQEGRIDDARRLYDMMPKKDVVARTNMIGGYFQIDRLAEACEIFYEMPRRNVVSWTTMVSRNLFQAMPIKSVVACNAMILGYGENGEVAKAREVFDNMRDRDERTWSAMIKFYECKGFELEALDLFALMQREGIRLNFPSLISVLSVCGSLANHDHGRQIHAQLVEPGTAHYACMVDLLGRAGQVKKAMDLIKKMPVETDAIVWGALLGACRQHMKLDLAEVSARKLTEPDPEKAGPYVLLSNIYASQGRWHDVAELRENMRARSLRKSPGCSWIEVEKNVHMFTGGESTGHPEHEMIMRELERLGVLLREAGYCPDGSFVLHDVEEEEKVHSLGYHSEKLAIAYGLLKVPQGMPIRVMKNLQVRLVFICYMTINFSRVETTTARSWLRV
ncbi:hypothetical protein C1H46_002651 [Malus baccata]|uniref:DYW domain-containing protein n=1 Tax=Malus baccata TaxID=106549 RepID=A0A540NL96_MALBA|nr:hypothetical protein C1H46_002651 [Malus baccata]